MHIDRSLRRIIGFFFLAAFLTLFHPIGFMAAQASPALQQDYPIPWSQFWAQSSLHNNPGLVAYVIPASEDTYVRKDQAKQNFGHSTSGLIGNDGDYAGLLKFDPNAIPHEGTQPIAGVYLALPLKTAKSSMDTPWIGVMAACRSWSETSATWKNASCLQTSMNVTDWADQSAQWLLLDLTYHLDYVADGYYLRPAGSSGMRTFLTREAGSEWAPRLIVTYYRDQIPPSINWSDDTTKPVYFIPVDPDPNAFPPITGPTVRVTEDIGIQSIVYRKTVVSTGEEEIFTQSMENGCQLVQSSFYEAALFPFEYQPMGRRLNLSVQVTDCMGKRSDPLVFSNLYLVERTESASTRDFLDEPLEKVQIKRSQDRDQYPELPPQRVGYGKEDVYPFGSISSTPSFWVDAPGYPSGDQAVLAAQWGQGRWDLHVPWYGYRTVLPGGANLAPNAPLTFQLSVPEAYRVILGTVATDPSGWPGSPGGTITFSVTPPGGSAQVVSSSYLGGGESKFVSADLSPWIGQTITGTLSLSSQQQGLQTVNLEAVVLAPQNPELSVEDRHTIVSTADLRSGITVTLPYEDAILFTTVTTTLTVTVPNSLSMTNSSPAPSRAITDTAGVQYQWDLLRITPPGGAIQLNIRGDQAGTYPWDVAIDNPRDPYRDNNQARFVLTAADHLLFIPVVLR